MFHEGFSKEGIKLRVLTIISGVLLVLTGVFCFANPGETFLSLAFVLGLIMVLYSIIQGAAYWWGRSDKSDNNGWILTEAVITFVLGVLVLGSHIAADAAVPMVFGLWTMFSGVLRLVSATMIDWTNKKANFVWTLITGLLCAIGGIYAFVNPVTANLPISVLLGIMFLLQGVSALELGIHMPHEKKVKQPKALKQKKVKKEKRRHNLKEQKEAPLVVADIMGLADEAEEQAASVDTEPVQQVSEQIPKASEAQEAVARAKKLQQAVEKGEAEAAEDRSAEQQADEDDFRKYFTMNLK